MGGLEFNCPHCQHCLQVPEEGLGESIECPSCGASFHLPKADPQPEPAAPVEQGTSVESPSSARPERQSKACPFCGEVTLAAARECTHCGESLDASSRFAMSASTSRTAEPEQKIWQGRPSGLYYLGHWIVGMLFLPVCGLGLVFIGYAILDQGTRVFTLTTRKVMAEVGIISRKTREVAIRDIRSINMDQNMLERLFNLGSLQIGSSGTGGVEVEFKGIANPAKVRDAIRETKYETDG